MTTPRSSDDCSLDFSEQIKLKMSYVIAVYDVFSVSLPTDAGLIFKKRPPFLFLTQGKIVLWNGQTYHWPCKVVILGYGTGNQKIGFKARLLLISECVISPFVNMKPESEWRC